MGTKKEIVAMLLAGGQGSRLQVLTKDMAKPAVPYGGKYRIIDFPLSNCVNSGITTVGVLTQYMPLELNSYVGNGQPWDLDRMNGGLSILPPYTSGKAGEWYLGTANAIYQNMNYIEQYNPDYVLVLSGDHIYKMNYDEMLRFHKEKGAALTIATLTVTLDEAKRFGILNTNSDLSVYEFEEKPQKPKSTNASMGIYIFDWKKMKQYLEIEENMEGTDHDFGKDVIPLMLEKKEKIYAYPYEGYWKDVGTIESLWEANMDLIHHADLFNMSDPLWRIYCRHFEYMPQYIGDNAETINSLISEGSDIRGKVEGSIISTGTYVEEGAEIYSSVIMANAVIKKGAVVKNAIIAADTVIEEDVKVGVDISPENLKNRKYTITVIGKGEVVKEDILA